MRLLFLLLLAAAPFAADAAAPREPFPDDYVVSPCAPPAEELCGGVKKVDFANLAHIHRGLNINYAWIDAHWEEMKNEVYGPLCTKMANCYTIVGNTTVWCQDQFRSTFMSACERFPEGSKDREQCGMFAITYFTTLGIKADLHAKAQECSARDASPAPRKFEAWVTPDLIRLDGDELITVHAIDTERRIPVLAWIATDGGGRLKATEGPDEVTAIPSTWVRRLKRVPNDAGHEDLVAPTLTITAPGYESVTLRLPVEKLELKFEMKPAPAALRRGKNMVTITACDSKTGEPVELRVMGGEYVLGNTNVPFELIVGAKRPEIWLTSLFDRYDDVVVAPAE
jgi:hypothetical protein